MSVLRPLLVCVLTVLPSWGATFGTVVPHTQPIADLVLDAARKRLYLVDTYSNQIDVYSTASNPPALVTTINTSATPQMPPPNGLMYFASKSQLQATPDGAKIIGVNQTASTRTVFVFDVASSTVLASRTISGISPILAVSPNGSEFLSGSVLFETVTLLVLAQQNTTNSPFVFAAAPISPPRRTRVARRSCRTVRNCSPLTTSFRSRTPRPNRTPVNC